MGRKSTGEYPPNWKEIATTVKDEAGWKCVRCGHAHDIEAGYMLTVHHLTLEKDNCAWWNTPALCQRCHLKIQGKVIMERPWFLPHSDWFKPYVAGYYAFVYGLPDDKQSVMDRMDELILMGQNYGAAVEDMSELAAAWPTLANLPDGVDIFAAKYGEPYGSEK
jgi:hypothetical protein